MSPPVGANGVGLARLRFAARGRLAVLAAEAGIDVGAGCVVGDWALISDSEPTFDDPERPTRLQPLRSAPVRIGDGARIGVHAVVQATVAPGDFVAPYETRARRGGS